MKQASLASSLFVVVVRVDVTLNVQFLMKFTAVTTANPLQSHFTLDKGPFPLRAWKRAFFVCFIDFFCARFNFNRWLQSKINKRNKECSFPRS